MQYHYVILHFVYLICLFEIHNDLLKTADLIIQVMEPNSEQTIVNLNTLIEKFYNKLYLEITGDNSYTYRSMESAQAIGFSHILIWRKKFRMHKRSAWM